MGKRQRLADRLGPLWHAARKHEARKQNVGQEEEERQLHRLKLVIGDGRPVLSITP
jgi:hypothetical protein